MEYQPYLIIELHETRYGINAYAVQEIFFLPEITLIPEAPLDVVGVINLRGDVLPIVDLHRRFGFPTQPYKLSDSVVVVANETGDRVGLIVNRTYEVQSIDTANITQAPGHHSTDLHRFVAGIAKLESELITLLQAELIVRYGTLLTDFTDPLTLRVATESSGDSSTGSSSAPQSQGSPWADPSAESHGHNGLGHNGDRSSPADPPIAPNSTASSSPDPTGDRPLEPSPRDRSLEAEFWQKSQPYRLTVFFPHATPAEREVLLNRARNLRNRTEEVSFSGLLPYAVVGLQGEFFALGLEFIHEFTDVDNVTPIPCCPPHIVGNLNLRGEILTLVDISGILNLPLERSEQSHKAIVARSEQLVAGITVDDVFDVIYLRPADISPIPAAVHALNDEYIRGVAPYQNKQMSILDLPKLLTSSELVVDEVV
ncbi:MAG: chemotaxis protein CheW [Prochlorothrix sp.]